MPSYHCSDKEVVIIYGAGGGGGGAAPKRNVLLVKNFADSTIKIKTFFSKTQIFIKK